jgi:hypothetical protein
MLYEIKIAIYPNNRNKEAVIKKAVGYIHDYSTCPFVIDGDYGWLYLRGECDLQVGVKQLADRISKDVWKANGAYCLVHIYITCHAPSGKYNYVGKV